jgi:hypothetical protein
LISPVTTLTDGRWVARTRWIPTARAFWAIFTIGILDLAALAHDQVGELVDDQDDVRHPLVRRLVAGDLRPAVVGAMFRTLWPARSL